jgi:hypothetical protein
MARNVQSCVLVSQVYEKWTSLVSSSHKSSKKKHKQLLGIYQNYGFSKGGFDEQIKKKNSYDIFSFVLFC